MKKILLLTICYFSVNLVYSQSDKQLTHYMFDKMSFNPGATGYKGYCGTIVGREQWVATDNAPRTILANLEANIQNLNAGVGLSLSTDAIGFGSALDVKLNYAQHINFAGAGILSPGIGLGLTSMAFDPDWIAPETGTDVSLDPNLPISASATTFDVSFGLFWRGTSMPYYVGISSTHLTQPYLEAVNFEKARHYYVTGGFDIGYNMLPLVNGLTLKPSFLVINEGVTTSFDLTLLGDYEINPVQSIYAGLTYRRKDALAILIGFTQLKTGPKGQYGSLKGDPDKWNIGYSYDITTSSINQYSRGSHELMFKYCVFPPDPSRARHGNVFILQ